MLVAFNRQMFYYFAFIYPFFLSTKKSQIQSSAYFLQICKVLTQLLIFNDFLHIHNLWIFFDTYINSFLSLVSDIKDNHLLTLVMIPNRSQS